jgi:hypothetical protein
MGSQALACGMGRGKKELEGFVEKSLQLCT